MKLDNSISYLQNASGGDKVRDSRIILKEVMDNQDYLERRKVELENILKVSSQIKEITVMMGQEVKAQGELLLKIDVETSVAKNNVENAELDIISANNTSRQKTKKVLFLTLAIGLLIIAVIIIVAFIISK